MSTSEWVFLTEYKNFWYEWLVQRLFIFAVLFVESLFIVAVLQLYLSIKQLLNQQ